MAFVYKPKSGKINCIWYFFKCLGDGATLFPSLKIGLPSIDGLHAFRNISTADTFVCSDLCKMKINHIRHQSSLTNTIFSFCSYPNFFRPMFIFSKSIINGAVVWTNTLHCYSTHVHLFQLHWQRWLYRTANIK